MGVIPEYRANCSFTHHTFNECLSGKYISGFWGYGSELINMVDKKYPTGPFILM